MPQLFISGLYFGLNNLLTRTQVAVEWGSYALSRKPLRVSHNRTGSLRSTYFLQLPYRYSFPVMGLSATLHWLASQSLFLITFDYSAVDPTDIHVISNGRTYVTCGCSLPPMICIIILGTLATVFFIIFSMKKLEGDMPIVGCHSTGISAACHPPEEENDATKPLMWGAINAGLFEDTTTNEAGEVVGHCSFSSSAVAVPVPGRLYS
jgi:hypothetical protein